MRFPSWLFCFLFSGCNCFETPWHSGYEYHRPAVVPHLDEPQEKHHHYHAKAPAMPRDVMVDVINDLGLKLLAIHNEDNENNIAISPYGALCVLVALSEGLQGQATWEIYHAAQIPKDRAIIRVGLRDIHRHLKSYFIPEEGFLAGLTLNHDNVTLKPEYEEILKFYGYDYGTFNNALYPEPLTTSKPETTTFIIKTRDKEDSTTMLPVSTPEELTSTMSQQITTPGTTESPVTTTESLTTTVKINVEEISSTKKEPETTKDLGISRTNISVTTIPKLDTITEEATAIISISTTESAQTVPVTTFTMESASTTILSTSSEKQTDTTQASQTSSAITEEPTTVEVTTIKNIATSTDQYSTTKAVESTTPATQFTTLLENITPEITTAVKTTLNTAEEITVATQPFVETMPPVRLTPEEPFDSNTPAPFGNINAANQPQFIDEFNTQPTEVGDIFATMPPNFADVTTQPPPNNMFDYPFYPDVPAPLANETNYADPTPNFVENTPNPNQFVQGKRSVRRTARSVVDYLIARYYDEQHNHHQPHGGGEANHHHHHSYHGYIPEEPQTFLVYGKYREAKINFMRYDTVLPFLYVPHLNALALSFPLDSTKYYLLLLLPVEEDGIDQLVCDLRLHGSLRYIIENLKLHRVVATIPSFTLKGYVILTPTFQKLGIQKVFEPRQADFSPMTNQTEIYVTNIEQAVTVTIRNYVDPSSEYNNKNLLQYEPVHFKADHPFLYFVIDSELHVALMEGKVVNPLNSRIR